MEIKNYYVIPGISINALTIRESVDITEEQIINYVCMDYGTTLEELRSKNRKREKVEARAFCFLFMKKYLRTQLVKMGQKLNRDHSTVIKSLENIQNDIQNYETVKQRYNRIRLRITGNL